MRYLLCLLVALCVSCSSTEPEDDYPNTPPVEPQVDSQVEALLTPISTVVECFRAGHIVELNYYPEVIAVEDYYTQGWEVEPLFTELGLQLLTQENVDPSFGEVMNNVGLLLFLVDTEVTLGSLTELRDRGYEVFRVLTTIEEQAILLYQNDITIQFDPTLPVELVENVLDSFDYVNVQHHERFFENLGSLCSLRMATLEDAFEAVSLLNDMDIVVFAEPSFFLQVDIER